LEAFGWLLDGSRLRKQLKLVAAGLPILTWEINYWAMDGEFDGYPADHDDSLIANALTVL
jgi:hypothetical protein